MAVVVKSPVLHTSGVKGRQRYRKRGTERERVGGGVCDVTHDDDDDDETRRSGVVDDTDVLCRSAGHAEVKVTVPVGGWSTSSKFLVRPSRREYVEG